MQAVDLHCKGAGMKREKPACHFVITKAGKVKHSDWSLVSCSAIAAQSLYDAVAPEFGRAVARKVLNSVCVGDYQMRLIHEIGTISRMCKLHEAIESVGRYVPGAGFFAYADEILRIAAE
jgi:hypothetical protein